MFYVTISNVLSIEAQLISFVIIWFEVLATSINMYMRQTFK